MVGHSLIGVLSLYSTARDAFTEEHQRIAEIVARQVAPVIQQAAESQRSRVATFQDKVTGLPHLDQFRDLAAAQIADASTHRPVSVLLIAATCPEDSWNRRVDDGREDVQSRVVSAARRSLRAADILFRYRSDELVALLLQTNDITARTIAARIGEAIRAEQQTTEHKPFLFSVGVASAPRDGGSVEELLEFALYQRHRSPADGSSSGDSSNSVH